MSSRLDPNRVFSGMATEHTLKEVVKAVSEINLNVGDIIVGDISVQSDDTTTHSKLDTLNTTVINKTLNKNTSSIDVSGQTLNVNVISDSLVVEPVLYNLQIVGEDIYADSINGPIVDPYGRDGWFWTNSATTGGSNAYWYSNTIVPQNQMTKQQIECLYIVLALDRVKPDIVLPIITMYSLPTGSGDISAGFAHSRWTYVIPATNILNAGEVIMLTIGDHSKVARIRPELRRVHLELFGTIGDALSTEVIGLISLNTDSGTKLLNSVQYLLKNAGFYYSVTNKIVEYEFNNGVQNAINVNLTEGGIKISNTVTVGGNINIDNFPISQAVTGTFWQATQPVSGSITVSNLPAVQTVSGSVSVSNLPAVQTVDGSVGISNFPNIQAVSGTVNIGNLPITQPISGSVSVSNFPASQAVTGSFWQATQPVSGTVAVSNTGFNVNNFPVSQAVTGTFWQATQPVSGSVSVSNLPAVQTVDGSVSISNFPATQAVSGNVTVNTISGFALESGGNLASIKTNTDKIKSDTTNTDAIQVQVKNSTIPVSGNVTVNTISGFALDTTTQSTNTKLDTIHTDLDGLTYDASSNLNVNVVAGSLTLDSVKIKATNGDSITATTGSINSNITNISLDTHCYASSNGTNWHHLASDSNGQLNVHSKLQDGAGTDITSTLIGGSKQSLDVNVANTVAVNTISGFALETGGNLASIKTNTDKIKSDTTNTDAIQVQVKNSSIAVTGTITANISANQRVLANVYDKQDNGITSTNHTVSKYGLDTTSALATTDMTTRYLLTSTSDGGSKRGLDVNIASGSVAITAPSAIPVTGNFYQTTQPVSFDTSSSIPVTGNITIDNDSTTNFNSTTGLNVYQILPKVKMYSLGGFDGNSTANSLIIGSATVAQVTSSAAFNFGGTMQFWAVLGSGGSRSITFDYVDASGNIQTTTADNINSSTTISLGTFKSILDFRLSSSIVSGETLYIGTSSVVNTLKERSVYYEDINQKLVGAITIPNDYIGYITNLTSQTNTASNITLNRWNSSGVKSAVWRVNNQGNVNINSGYDGTLGGIFNAGDTLAFSAQTAVAGKSVIANLVLKSIL